MTPRANSTDLKYYNCFEPGHISRDYPKSKTERTKQILAAKLAMLSAKPQQALEESKNKKPWRKPPL